MLLVMKTTIAHIPRRREERNLNRTREHSPGEGWNGAMGKYIVNVLPRSGEEHPLRSASSRTA